MLSYLFGPGAAPTCLDAADTDDDGKLQITDAVYALNHLFSGGATPREPFAECGPDPATDELDCEQFTPCSP